MGWIFVFNFVNLYFVWYGEVYLFIVEIDKKLWYVFEYDIVVCLSYLVGIFFW